MIIDSHHHLWNYSREEYGWISDEMSVLARDFSPGDLIEAAKTVGVTGSIVVQARQTLEETRWLLDLADEDDFLLAVVGWAPLAATDADVVLDEFSGQKKLKGFRHVVQDEPDADFILGADFNRGVERVLSRDLVYDLLIFERQLPQAIEFVDRHPNGRFVLDHIAKPRIAKGEINAWRAKMKLLAQRENVVCKISGVVTEADWSNWSLDLIRPYLDVALESFGPDRLMFGSDWPVCLLASSYSRWLATVQQWATSFSEDERASLFHNAAAAIYRLKPSTP